MIGNVGGYEILVIAIVALIAVGPEQLPSVMRKVGRTAAQLRNMASGMRDEFMAGVNDMADMADLKELTDPDAWLGSGSDDDPIVPRGYAQRSQATGTARSSAPSNGAGNAAAADNDNDNNKTAPAAEPTAAPAAMPAAIDTSTAPTPDGEGDEPAGTAGSRP